MAQSLDTMLEARQAAEDSNWSKALELLGSADRDGILDATDLQLLGDAAWWNAEMDLAVDARQRAFASYLKQGDNEPAAHLALALVRDYGSRMQIPQAMAFMGRAERLLAPLPPSPVHGEFAIMQADFAIETGDSDKALTYADEALAISREFNDLDLEGMALVFRGRALVQIGEVAEGLKLLDEATASALCGTLGPEATGMVYCCTISTCADLGDYQRAGEWSRQALNWCERHSNLAGFPGVCRIHHAEVLRFSGDWPRAEEAARVAAKELGQIEGLAAEAWYEIGEIRMRLGDDDGAEEAFRQAHDLGREPQPGLALLWARRGKADSAFQAIERALAGTVALPLRRSKLLPGMVRVALQVGQIDTARTAAEELRTIASGFSSSASLQALAECALGEVALADGDALVADGHLRTALNHWLTVKSPYETARTRLLLAEALTRLGDLDAAGLELSSARAALERLGARPDVREAKEALARLTSVDQHDGQRTVRTFMFTDIVDSTPLVSAIGDDAWTDLVRWHDHVLRSTFASYNGEELDHAGDGFLVAFADAGSALACAVAIQRLLAEHRREHGFAPSVRIGLHATEAVADRETFRGQGVHAAARIAALAGGGQILLSATTATEAGRDYDLDPVREVTLKGLDEPVEVTTVDWR